MKRVAAVVLAGLVVAACSTREAELTGIVRLPLPSVGGVSLPDASAGGAAFAARARPGGVLLVYFGYTSCPDVCPTTLAEVRSALADLGDDSGLVDVAMVTVDPARDTPEVLTGYLQSFIPTGHALRTEDEGRLQAAAAAFGAAYQVVVSDDGAVEVSHTGHLYAVDDEGLLEVTWPFGVQSADLVSDIEILLSAP